MAMAAARFIVAPPLSPPVPPPVPPPLCFGAHASAAFLSRSQFKSRRIGSPSSFAIYASASPDSSGDGNQDDGEQQQSLVQDLKLPDDWTTGSVAAQEAEWLRAALHRWLDDEYCPEPANIEISKRCANAYYRCLMEKELDAGNILMQMVHNLESFSFKESFHGAFSSANAAVDLILQRARASDKSA